MVIVHFDELVQVDAVQVENAAKMVSENKVVTELDYSFNIVRITLLQKKEQLGLNCSLVVVFLLILDEFNSHQLFILVVKTFNNLSKSSFSYNFNELESESNMVSLLNTIVAFFVIESVVDQSLHITCFYFVLILAKIVQLIIFVNFCLFEISQVLVSN